MRRLTMQEYQALPHEERTLLRRAAFGAAVPLALVDGFDLAHIRALLIAENERTAVMPERWTDQGDDDEIGDFL